MTDSEKMATRMEQATIRDRHKDIAKQRFGQNVRRHPWILAISLLLLLVMSWAMACISIPLPGGNSSSMLISLWNHSVKVAVWLIAFLLVTAVLTSAPPQAKALEAALAHIKFTDRYGYCPALISRVCAKPAKIEKLTFYSAGISLESWAERQGDIQDALNVVYVEPPQYAYNKRHYVMLTVVPGIAKPREEPLYDDEL